jgi:hypothetical protein
MALLAGRASAGTNPPTQFTILNVSGTFESGVTNYDKLDRKGTNVVDTNEISFEKTMTFNNKTIYSIISNAVANAQSISESTNVPTATLPPDGYIAFSQGANDFAPTGYYAGGFFYVTNKSGFYFPLSGEGSNNTAYSWMEFETQVSETQVGGSDSFYLGFAENFDGGANRNYDVKTEAGSISTTSTALLFIHDNPLGYDDADYPGVFYLDNGTAIEIRGILKISLTIKDGNMTATSATLTGTGNYVSPANADFDGGEVISATAKLTK